MTDPRSQITALIPAAGRVPEGVLALSNVTCPAMIPVAGRPVIQWTMNYLRSLGITTFEIAVAERGLFVEEFVDCLYGASCDINYLVPSRDGGPGLTVYELARQVRTPSALVVLGDTHFEFRDPGMLDGDEPAVLVDVVEESYRWCIAEIGDDGRVKGFRDKVPGMPHPLQALIGVYWFPDAQVLHHAAADAVASSEGRVELSTILSRVSDDHPVLAVPAGAWLDCGNADRQAAAQRALLQKRAFNELTVDDTFGTITKRSRLVGKFLDEIAYLQQLPNELAVLFPRVLDASEDADDPHVTMEFYGYPTLAELFVFENVDAGIWRRVFEHVRSILTDGFMQRARSLPPGAVHEMLLGKAHRRLASLADEGTGEHANLALLDLIDHPGPVRINGHEVANLHALRDRLADAVAGLERSASGTVIHGDLCFSNVLYDLRSGICKLIDPRGSFGERGIYGDPRYDVAKLYHSVYGGYDFITADLFQVGVDGDEIAFDIRCRPYHHEIRLEFDEVFFGPASPFDRREILLVTGLIFVGLPPLHYDQPLRQLALYVRGLQLLDEALAG